MEIALDPDKRGIDAQAIKKVKRVDDDESEGQQPLAEGPNRLARMIVATTVIVF